MQYEEFADLAAAKMKTCFPEMELHLQRVEKLQGQSYNALVVKAPGDVMGMTFNMDEFYSRWKESDCECRQQDGPVPERPDDDPAADSGTDRNVPGEDEAFRSVMGELEHTIRHTEPHPPMIDVEKLHSYAKMRECLSMQLVPVKGNEELLSRVPHLKRKDLAVVFRFVFPGSPQEEASVLLTNSLLASCDVTAQQITEDAFLICPANRPLLIRNMEEVLFGIQSESGRTPEEDDDSGDTEYSENCRNTPEDLPERNNPEKKGGVQPGLWVISNDIGRNGAAAVFYPGALEKIAVLLGCGYYLIPSSVHEMIALPDPLCMGAASLDQMVESVNATEVSPEDRLTDHCYHYDPETSLFEAGKEYEARIAGGGYSA